MENALPSPDAGREAAYAREEMTPEERDKLRAGFGGSGGPGQERAGPSAHSLNTGLRVYRAKGGVARFHSLDIFPADSGHLPAGRAESSGRPGPDGIAIISAIPELNNNYN